MSNFCKSRSPLRGGLLQNSGARIIRKCSLSSSSKDPVETARSNPILGSSVPITNAVPTAKTIPKKCNFRRIKCEYIRGKKWYPFLIHKDSRKQYLCLLDDLGYNSTNIYVRLTTNGYYMFSCFTNAIELWDYIEQFHPSFRCFDEIIMEGPQKPRFDLDLEEDQYPNAELDRIIQILINQVIDGITFYLTEISIENNIKLFTSHGGSKRSAHIVVDGVFHDTYLDAKGFYDDVIRYVNPDFQKYVDHGIYGKKKQLRIMNCCKWKSDRTKILQSSFVYHDKIINCNWGELDNDVTRFISSLITVISGCVRLKSFTKKSPYTKSEDIADVTVSTAIEISKKFLGENYTFSFESVSGSIIVLRRLSPSYCIICNRIHDKQHPYLYVLGNNIYFNCRRHPKNKNQYIGNMSNAIVEVKSNLEPLRIVDTTTTDGKIIQISDGASFNFRKKGDSRPSPDIQEETIETQKEEAELDISLCSTQDISVKLNSIDKKRNIKRRKPKLYSDIPLSSLVDYDKIEW